MLTTLNHPWSLILRRSPDDVHLPYTAQFRSCSLAEIRLLIEASQLNWDARLFPASPSLREALDFFQPLQVLGATITFDLLAVSDPFKRIPSGLYVLEITVPALSLTLDFIHCWHQFVAQSRRSGTTALFSHTQHWSYQVLNFFGMAKTTTLWANW